MNGTEEKRIFSWRLREIHWRKVTSYITVDKNLIKFLRYFCYFPTKFLILKGTRFLSYDVTRGKNYNCFLIYTKGKVYVERLLITVAACIKMLQKFYLKKQKIERGEKHTQAQSKNPRFQREWTLRLSSTKTEAKMEFSERVEP